MIATRTLLHLAASAALCAPLALTISGCSGSGSSGGGTPQTPGAGTTPASSSGSSAAGAPSAPSAPTQPAPGPTQQPSPGTPAVDDLSSLSDDFSDPARFSAWQRVFQVEGWGFDQLESQDVGQTKPGWLTLVPYTSSWYEDYRGVLVFKEVSGDFVVTTEVEASDRAGSGAPARSYSLAGIMVRTPRVVTPATWQRGGENYVFLSLGAADAPGTFQTEVKTTSNSQSTLEIDSAPSGQTTLRFARIGASVICLIRPIGTQWRVHRRFTRSDFPASLQVGLTVYTDWETISASYTPEQQNTTLITTGVPDLRAQFDHVTYARPAVPSALAGRDLADPNQVSDAELLAFLGL